MRTRSTQTTASQAPRFRRHLKLWENVINAFARPNGAVASSQFFRPFCWCWGFWFCFTPLSRPIRTTSTKAFSAEQTNLGPDVLKDELARADEYNRQAAEAPILDPWLESQRPNTPQYSNYLSQLDVNPVMATVKVPSADISLPIYHGTETSTLEKGVGHLFGTALPVGGEGTHTVLTGHSGLGSATMFDHLNRVKVGDVFYIEVLGRHLKYKVTDIRTVLPNETESLNKVAGKDLATLITCTPYGINTHRLLVTGERVPMDDQQVAAESAKVEPAVVQTWMIAVVVGIIAVLITTAVLWGFARKNRKKLRSTLHNVDGQAAR